MLANPMIAFEFILQETTVAVSISIVETFIRVIVFALLLIRVRSNEQKQSIVLTIGTHIFAIQYRKFDIFF